MNLYKKKTNQPGQPNFNNIEIPAVSHLNHSCVDWLVFVYFWTIGLAGEEAGFMAITRVWKERYRLLHRLKVKSKPWIIQALKHNE